MRSIESRGSLSFAESGREHRGPIAVTNVLDRFGSQSLLEETKELSGKTVVDLDDRALTSPDAPLIVFGRPHAGEYVPTKLADRMTEGGLEMMTIIDRGTERIFKSDKIASVGSKMSRFVADPNRLPIPGEKSGDSKVPGQVLWYAPAFSDQGELDFDEQIYQTGKEPTKEEVEALVGHTYIPYYNGMMATTGSLVDRRESSDQRVLIIDGHSFPTDDSLRKYWKKYGVDDPREEMPLFVIGDQDGKSCDSDISDAFAEALKQNFDDLSQEDREKLLKSINGGVVARNLHLKGVRNVDFFEERPMGVNALQLEVNEHAYIDGSYSSFKYNERELDLVRRVVERSALDVDSLLKNKE